jgi:carboxylate-amine ligase
MRTTIRMRGTGLLAQQTTGRRRCISLARKVASVSSVLPAARPSSLPRFAPSAPYTLGVEEELFLVDGHDRRVSRVTDAVLAERPRFQRGRVLGELCDGVIELATPVCEHAAQAADHLGALRAAVLDQGVARLLGAGVHPTTAHGDVAHRRGRHYDAVAADTRSLLRQTAYNGVHIHVGMPDPETTIAAFNGMRKWVPLLQALSANSPYWYGRDSGLASSRTVVCHSVPRTGLPAAFEDWSHYEHTAAQLVRVGELDGIDSIWWDMRPHPRLGTLEIRVCDAQSSLDDLEGIVALVHGLVRHEAVIADDEHPPKAILDEACFRAVRDGLDARFSIGGPLRHVQDVARHAIAIAAPHAARLGGRDALEHLERLLSDGNGAIRQRRAHARGGLPEVLRLLIDETCARSVRTRPVVTQTG